MARKKAVVDDIDMTSLTVTRPQLASLFGVSERTLSTWTSEGMPREARGCFRLAPCVRWLQERIQRKGDDRDGSLAATKIRLFDSQRKHSDLAMAQRREELVRADETATILRRLFELVDVHLMKLPSLVTGQLVGQPNPSARAQLILRAARETRRQLADDLELFARGLVDDRDA